MRGSWIAVLISLCCVESATAADKLRCGRNLVSVGDSRYEVRTACGEPDDVQTHVEEREGSVWRRVPCNSQDKNNSCTARNSRNTQVTIDRWTYDFGTLQFIEFLTFENGSLVRIEQGARGKKR